MDNELRPPAAARIRAARLRAGLDAGTLGASLDLTFEGYRDLEDFDDEVFDCLSLRQVKTLAEILGVSAAALVAPEGAAIPSVPMSPEDLVRRLVDHMASQQFTADSFGDHVGWDVVPVVNQPTSIWDQWNIDCLADVCRELAVDWLPVLV